MANNWFAPFGLSDCKIASWSSAGSYGTVYDVPSIQSLGATQQTINGTLTGDDQITGTAANVIGAQLKMRFGGLHFDPIGVLLGRTATTSASVTQLAMAGGARLPYFGIIGKVLNADDGSDVWLYMPKCKLMGDWSFFQGEYGQFVIPEATVQCVADATYGIWNEIYHPTALAVTVMPPANIATVS